MNVNVLRELHFSLPRSKCDTDTGKSDFIGGSQKKMNYLGIMNIFLREYKTRKTRYLSMDQSVYY